jgi:A/G-specific adenine glycosylase
VISAALEAWFKVAARHLPWRTTPRDPYHALVAETMLQQTQVSRVIPAYARFIDRFPDVRSLAAAPIDDVFGLWSGLGYYRRARNLHAAAQMIVRDFNAIVPRDVNDLLKLPGVGRYTAGAIASIAFNQPAPIVDGNVKRVLLRLHGQDLEPDAKPTTDWAWAAAEQLAHAARMPGVTNEALMELGATVCLPPPASPACDRCALKDSCRAFALGLTSRIPRPKKRSAVSELFCTSIILRDKHGRLLVEQRPSTGMWAGLFQLPTLEHADDWPALNDLRSFVQIRGGSLSADALAAPTLEFTHQTTHRTVRFKVVQAQLAPCNRKQAGRMWITRSDLSGLGVSSAHKRAITAAFQVSDGLFVT